MRKNNETKITMPKSFYNWDRSLYGYETEEKIDAFLRLRANYGANTPEGRKVQDYLLANDTDEAFDFLLKGLKAIKYGYTVEKVG